MTIVEMLQQSGLLTLLGMGVVFTFIIVLILCMKLLQVCVSSFNRDKKQEKSYTKMVKKNEKIYLSSFRK